MKRLLIAGVSLLLLEGCVPTNSANPIALSTSGDDPMVYGRVDGKFVSPARIQQDMAICQGNVSAVTIDAPKVSTEQKGGVGLLDMGMQVIDRQQTVNSLEKGCMAQRGYVLMPRSQAPVAAKVRTARN